MVRFLIELRLTTIVDKRHHTALCLAGNPAGGYSGPFTATVCGGCHGQTDLAGQRDGIRAAGRQLAKLQEHRPDLTLGRIAQGAGLGANSRTAGPVLATALNRGPTLAQLHGLDEIIGALVPDLDGTGSLSSLALRLSPEQRDRIRRNNLAAHVPSSWTRKILADPPADEVGVLMQASALLSEFMAADPGSVMCTRRPVNWTTTGFRIIW